MKNNKKRVSAKYAKIKLEQWESKSYYLLIDEDGEKILVCPTKNKTGGQKMNKYLTKDEFYEYARATKQDFDEFKNFMMDFVKRQDKNWENQFKFNKDISSKLDRVITLNNLKS